MIGLLRRAGPLSLLGGSFILMVGGLAASRAGALAVAGLLVAVATPLCVGPGGFPWRRMIAPALAIISVGWSNWLLAEPHSLPVAAFAALRIGFFVVPGVVFASFIDPAALGDHLGQRLRLPGRPVVAMVAALQRFERLGSEWDELGAMRRVRGVGPTRSPVSAVRAAAGQALGLLSMALRDAADSAVAMEARGYSRPSRTGVVRTWAEPAPWTRTDTALICGCLLVSFVAIAGGSLLGVTPRL